MSWAACQSATQVRVQTSFGVQASCEEKRTRGKLTPLALSVKAFGLEMLVKFFCSISQLPRME